MRLIHPSEMGTMGLASPLVEATTKLNKWGETDDDDWDDLGGKDEFDFDGTHLPSDIHAFKPCITRDCAYACVCVCVWCSSRGVDGARVGRR